MIVCVSTQCKSPSGLFDQPAETCQKKEEADARRCLGRSRGGLTTKLHCAVSGQLLHLILTAEHPTSAKVCEQAKKFIEHKPEIVIHDRDAKFSKEFTETLNSRGLRTNPLPKASPNLNGRCERFIETIKLECLSRFIVFGKRHLDHLVAKFTEYYNRHRSHMCRGHLLQCVKCREKSRSSVWMRSK